jgi:hypothetical protein
MSLDKRDKIDGLLRAGNRVGEVGARPKFFLVIVLMDDSRWRT